MSQRQLNQRLVTDVTLPDDHKAEMWQTGANMAQMGLDIKRKQDQANMNNYAAQANLDMAKATNDWRVANESNPMDDKAISELHSQYDSILNKYDENVGFLSRGDWGKVKNKIKTDYQAQNMDWGVKRSVKNAKISINSSIKTNLQMAAEYGRSGDIVQARKHFNDSSMGIDVAASGVIGDESKSALTSDFKADYMKSFMVGMAETNPDKVLELLSENGDKNKIREDIGDTDDINTIKAYATKQKNLMAKQQTETRNASVNSEYLNIIKGRSSFDQIDNGVAEGKYGAKEAQFLKSLFVKSNPVRDDKLTIARYLDALSGLPIDNAEEAQALRENIMADPKIKGETKAMLLYDADISGGKGEAFSIADLAEGRVKDPVSKVSIFNPWTYGNKLNKEDAVAAFIKYKQSIQSSDTPATMRTKMNRAVSEVALENNSNLQGLTKEWQEFTDNTESVYSARLNENGEIETMMSDEAGSDDGESDTEEDNQDGD